MFLCIADHWEPKWKRPPRQVEYDRVAQWTREYPRLASRFTDSMGRHPQHTFFYPAEEYEPLHLDNLGEICRQGFGDVEVHLHHDNDTAAAVRDTLCRFTETLHHQHGFLRKDGAGRLSYAFIHGNWSLDNSRPDGRWCGVNNELSILVETGCYADLTMPSAPDPCQTRIVNSIYYATDDPLRPKSHDTGLIASVGGQRPKDSLLMIQGPLALDWSSPKWGILPRLENGDLTANRPPTLQRLTNWIKAGVKVLGREDWSFVKLHTHGAQEGNAGMLLGPPMYEFHLALQQFAREHSTFHYYYVTAHDLALLIHAAENGAMDPTLVLGRSSNSMQTDFAAISKS